MQGFKISSVQFKAKNLQSKTNNLHVEHRNFIDYQYQKSALYFIHLLVIKTYCA